LQRQIAIHRISVLLASPAQHIYEALRTPATDSRAPAAAAGVPAELRAGGPTCVPQRHGWPAPMLGWVLQRPT
jgi:hypothetical protein